MTRLLLRFFPRAWRERYGDELIDLVADTGLTPRAAADIARSGVRERARSANEALDGGVQMILGPAWRHPTAWAVVGAIVLIPTAFFVVLSMLVYQFGVTGLSAVADPINAWLNSQRYLDLALVVSPAIAAFFAGVPLVRIGLTRSASGSEASLAVRLRVANLAVVMVGLAIASLLVLHIVFESVMQVG
jgi:hypothetical protein